MSLAAPPPMQQPSCASPPPPSPLPSPAAPARSPGPAAPSAGPVPHVHVRRKPSPSSASPGSVARSARSARPPLSTSAVFNHAKVGSPDAPSLSKHPLTSSSSSFATPPAPESTIGDPDADASNPSASQGSRRGGIFHRKFNTSTDNISLSSRLSISSTVSSASVMIRRSATSLGAGVTRGRNKISRASKHSIMGISNIFTKDKDKEREKNESLEQISQSKVHSPRPAHTAPNPVPKASQPTAPNRNFSAPPGSSSTEFTSRAPGAGVSVSHMTIEAEADAAATTRGGLSPAAFYVRQMQEAEHARAVQQQAPGAERDTTGSNHGDSGTANGQTLSTTSPTKPAKPSWRAYMLGESDVPNSDGPLAPALPSGPSSSANQLSAAGSGIRRSSSTRSAKETSDALLRHAADLRADAAPSAAATRDQAEQKRASQIAEPEERTASSFYEIDSSWASELPPLQFTDQSFLGFDSDLQKFQSAAPTEMTTAPLTAPTPATTAPPEPAATPPQQPANYHPIGSLPSVESLGSHSSDLSAPGSFINESDLLSQWAEGIERGRVSAARAPTPRSILKRTTGTGHYASTAPESAVLDTNLSSALPTTRSAPATNRTNSFPFASSGPTPPPPGASPSPAPSIPYAPTNVAESGRTKKALFAPRAQLHTTWAAHIYDRRGELTTANRLTPVLAQQIKEELNAYKMEEMSVAPSSHVYTQFFV